MKCNFCKPFILIFMQNDGGVPPADIAPFHSVAQKMLTHVNSLHCALFVLCYAKKKAQPVCFQAIAHSLSKTAGCGVVENLSTRGQGWFLRESLLSLRLNIIFASAGLSNEHGCIISRCPKSRPLLSMLKLLQYQPPGTDPRILCLTLRTRPRILSYPPRPSQTPPPSRSPRTRPALR